ncbi:MAG: RES family NAD+ phosphorylase [Gemmatimonadaceae bacterium]
MRQARGRWNRYGEYGCLYTTLTRDGAVAEHRKAAHHAGLDPRETEPRDLVSILVTVAPVLDLTDARVRRRYQVTLAALRGDDEGDLETCRMIADIARAEGYRAILSPSAARRGAQNLTIYLEGRAAKLRLVEGADREPLNYDR